MTKDIVLAILAREKKYIWIYKTDFCNIWDNGHHIYDIQHTGRGYPGGIFFTVHTGKEGAVARNLIGIAAFSCYNNCFTECVPYRHTDKKHEHHRTQHLISCHSACGHHYYDICFRMVSDQQSYVLERVYHMLSDK